MFTTQFIFHVDGDGGDDVPGHVHNTTPSFMLMEMVVMMFPDMFTTQFIFHVDGDGVDDVP